MTGSRAVVLVDAPDFVDDYLTVRLSMLGEVARTSSRAVEESARDGDFLADSLVSDVVVWVSEATSDAPVRETVEATLPAVASVGGSVVVVVDDGVAEERTAWLRGLAESHRSTQLHLLRHAPVAAGFWDCRGDLQTMTSSGHVALPDLADAVAAVMTDRTPGYRESLLAPSE